MRMMSNVSLYTWCPHAAYLKGKKMNENLMGVIKEATDKFSIRTKKIDRNVDSLKSK